jgi:hypothetical protein
MAKLRFCSPGPRATLILQRCNGYKLSKAGASTVRALKRFTTSPVRMAVALTQTLTAAQTMALPWTLGTVLSAQIWVLGNSRQDGSTQTSTRRIEPSTMCARLKIQPVVGLHGMHSGRALHRERICKQPFKSACGRQRFGTNPPSANARLSPSSESAAAVIGGFPSIVLASFDHGLLGQRKCRFAEPRLGRLAAHAG